MKLEKHRRTGAEYPAWLDRLGAFIITVYVFIIMYSLWRMYL